MMDDDFKEEDVPEGVLDEEDVEEKDEEKLEDFGLHEEEEETL
ncbi:MAG: hypothetical protein AAB582_03550 [Patescibacteria group bacterium]